MMNQKSLTILIAAAVVLGGLYFLTVPSSEPSRTTSEQALFAGVNGQQVAKVRIEQGAEAVELALQNGSWVLPARNGYPADGGKVRSLLLKLFDLSVSQQLPGGPETHDTLGVSEGAVTRGLGHIVLLDSGENILAGIRLGESRKTKSSLPAAMNGQYVRRDGDDAVYLIGSPISTVTAVTSWLDLNLLNVIPTAVDSVVQSRRSDSGQELLFELVRTGEKDNSGMPRFAPKGGVPEGKTLQDSVVAQIRSGMENLRISDIIAPDSKTAQGLTFDFETLYRTRSGLVYKIQTAQQGDKSYARFSAVFDTELAEKLKSEAEQAAAAPSPTPTPESASSADGVSSSPSPTATPAPKKPELDLSNQTEADKLNEQFKHWVYELPTYTAKKFRYTVADLTEPPPPTPSGAPSGAGSAFPPGMLPHDHS